MLSNSLLWLPLLRWQNRREELGKGEGNGGGRVGWIKRTTQEERLNQKESRPWLGSGSSSVNLLNAVLLQKCFTTSNVYQQNIVWVEIIGTKMSSFALCPIWVVEEIRRTKFHLPSKRLTFVYLIVVLSSQGRFKSSKRYLCLRLTTKVEVY